MKIKKFITVSLLMLGTSLASNAEVVKQDLTVTDSVLFQRMFVEKSISMPQLRVFNQKGVQLYGTDSTDESLKKNLLAAIKNSDKKGENSFDKHLSGVVDAKGEPVKLATTKSSNLIIVESYVDWFDGSKVQRKNIKEVLSQVGNQDVLWLTLDVDPKKISGATVTFTDED